MTPASSIFFLLLLADSVLFSLFIGLGKGAHQFSKILFPLRYQVEVMKNDYQRVVNELSTVPSPRPTITPRPSLTPTLTPRPTPRIIYKRPTAYPTSKPYTYSQPQPFPTTDWSWINQKAAENKAWYDQQVAKQKADAAASKAASEAWFNEQVAKQQAEQEAWKKAHGF